MARPPELSRLGRDERHWELDDREDWDGTEGVNACARPEIPSDSRPPKGEPDEERKPVEGREDGATESRLPPLRMLGTEPRNERPGERDEPPDGDGPRVDGRPIDCAPRLEPPLLRIEGRTLEAREPPDDRHELSPPPRKLAPRFPRPRPWPISSAVVPKNNAAPATTDQSNLLDFMIIDPNTQPSSTVASYEHAAATGDICLFLKVLREPHMPYYANTGRFGAV